MIFGINETKNLFTFKYVIDARGRKSFLSGLTSKFLNVI